MGRLATSPLRYGGYHRFIAVDKINGESHVSGLGTSPLPCGGSPTPQSEGKIETHPKVG